MNIDRIAAWGSGAAVLLAVLAGLYISGSPLRQRAYRLDMIREQDLQQIAAAVERYWQAYDELPRDYAELYENRELLEIPRDPASGLDYPYRTNGIDAFTLCAGFEAAAQRVEARNFWYHPAGNHCYEFSVKPKAD